MGRSERSHGHPVQIPPTDVAQQSAQLFAHRTVAGLRCRNDKITYDFREFVVEGRPKCAITIGRLPTCDIRLDDGRVSKIHCMIERGDSSWTIRDLSSNGTLIHRAEEPVALRLGKDPMLLALSMEILIFDYVLMPVTASGDLGFFVVNQLDLRTQAFDRYSHAEEAAQRIGVSIGTIYNAKRKKRSQNR